MTFCLSLENLDPIIEAVSNLARENIRIFILKGDLGSGKTTLIRHFGESFGAKNITSPTFSLMQSYEISDFGMLFHYDLYMHNQEKFIESGFIEELDKNLHFIEWGECVQKLLKNIGYNYASIEISRDKHTALYKVSVG